MSNDINFNIERNFFDEFISLQESLSRYPLEKPGRISTFGWDIEFVSGSALCTNIEYQIIKRINDFYSDNESPVILDLGANIGISVLSYKRQFPAARIIAFEPDPLFLPILRRNLGRNGASDVKIIEAAAWIADGEANWFSEGTDGSRLIWDSLEISQSVIVPTVDLAHFLEQEIDLIKMDIEGAEFKVIPHLAGKLGSVKNISIECHITEDSYKPLCVLVDTLVDEGFQLSLNSYSFWHDLIQSSPPLKDHFWQYILVSGWRNPPPQVRVSRQITPILDLSFPLQLIKQDNTLRQLNDSLAKQIEYQNKLETLNTMIQSSIFMIQRALSGPFTPEGDHGWVTALPDLEPQADNTQFPERSILLLFEGEALLGPAHALHDDIRTLGCGRYSHWLNLLYFSASDNSDPNSNQRTYTILYLDPTRVEATETAQ